MGEVAAFAQVLEHEGLLKTSQEQVRFASFGTCLESSSQFTPSLAEAPTEKILTRTERAHWRLSWEMRLARNNRPPDAPRLVVTLHGLPATFASSSGFDLLATA